MIIQSIQSDNDITFLTQNSCIQLVNSQILRKVGQLSFTQGSIREVDSEHILINGTHLFKLQNFELKFIGTYELLASNNGFQAAVNDKKVIIMKDYVPIKSTLISKILPLDFIDSIEINAKNVFIQLHSSTFTFDYEFQLVEITQFDQEINQIVQLNDFGCLGYTFYESSDFEVYQHQKYQFEFNKYVSFDVNINFEPFKVTCFLGDKVHILATSNMSYGQIKLTYKCVPLKVKDILKLGKNLILISEQLQVIALNDQTLVSVAQYLEILSPQTIYANQPKLQYFSLGAYIFGQNQDQLEIYELTVRKEDQFTLIQQNIKSQCLKIQIEEDRIITYTLEGSVYHYQIYTLTFEMIKDYTFTKTYKNITYCRHFEGLMFWETDTKYIDKQPENTYIEDIETIESTTLILVDFQTRLYYELPNGIQSNLIQGKSIKCGFKLDYLVKKIKNNVKNNFILQTKFKIKVIAIDSSYKLHNLYEFGVLNEKLIMFKNSLPLEDLERLPILQSAKPEQPILYSEFYGNEGIVQTIYQFKYVKLKEQNLIDIKISQQTIVQRILSWSSEIYILCNNDQLFKLANNEFTQIYVCDSDLAGAFNFQNKIVIVKANGQVNFTKDTREIIMKIQL